MSDQYVYHLTTKHSWDVIQKQGLKPMMEYNSRLAREYKPCLYLCDLAIVPYWKILLNADILLRVPKSYIDGIKPFRYSEYLEYRVECSIPPQDIQPIDFPNASAGVMQELCNNYLTELSDIVTDCIRYYRAKEPDPEWGASLADDIQMILQIANRLDYSACDPKLLEAEMHSYAEMGEYTFADTYGKTKRRLWAQIKRYPKDELFELRVQLSEWLASHMPSIVLYASTGGWSVY